MPIRKKLGLALLTIVLSCAVIYWVTWERRPDLFVVQDEINQYPFGDLEAFLWADGPMPVSLRGRRLGDVGGRGGDLLSRARQLRDRESLLGNDITALESKLKEASADLEAGREASIEAYRRRELEPIERGRTQLEREVSELEAQLDPDSTRYDPLRVLVANRRVVLAQHRVTESQKRLEVANHVLANLAEFARPADLRRFQELDDRLQAARHALSETYKRRAELRSAAFSLLDTLRSDRGHQLGLLDFLYFSIGVSTTTTFGDIIPNHWFTRTVVTTQLLLSILIVGLFVNSLSNSLDGTKPPNVGPQSTSEGTKLKKDTLDEVART